jgi:hypothetical protein
VKPGLDPDAEETRISWAHPLSNYWKADEEEARFQTYGNRAPS